MLSVHSVSTIATAKADLSAAALVLCKAIRGDASWTIRLDLFLSGKLLKLILLVQALSDRV
jgi:hypothetical protein